VFADERSAAVLRSPPGSKRRICTPSELLGVRRAAVDVASNVVPGEVDDERKLYSSIMIIAGILELVN
jgi:hypothetical protein